MLELWLKRARIYVKTYADVNDQTHRYEAGFQNFAANQDRRGRVLLTFTEVKGEVEERVGEVERLRREREGGFEGEVYKREMEE